MIRILVVALSLLTAAIAAAQPTPVVIIAGEAGTDAVLARVDAELRAAGFVPERGDPGTAVADARARSARGAIIARAQPSQLDVAAEPRFVTDVVPIRRDPRAAALASVETLRARLDGEGPTDPEDRGESPRISVWLGAGVLASAGNVDPQLVVSLAGQWIFAGPCGAELLVAGAPAGTAAGVGATQIRLRAWVAGIGAVCRWETAQARGSIEGGAGFGAIGLVPGSDDAAADMAPMPFVHAGARWTLIGPLAIRGDAWLGAPLSRPTVGLSGADAWLAIPVVWVTAGIALIF